MVYKPEKSLNTVTSDTPNNSAKILTISVVFFAFDKRFAYILSTSAALSGSMIARFINSLRDLILLGLLFIGCKYIF